MLDLKAITVNIESAIVMDGGSLGLSLFGDVQAEHYTLDRAVSSLGTPRYEAIMNEAGEPLASGERQALLERLALLRDTLAEDDLNLYVVDEYLTALRRK